MIIQHIEDKIHIIRMEIISQSCMQIASGNILVVTDRFRECGGGR